MNFFKKIPVRLWALPWSKPATQRPVVLSVMTPDFLRQWQFCIDSQSGYCARYNFEHRVIDVSESPLHPTWAKVELTIGLLEQGRDVLSIDADAEIAANCPPFTDILNASPERDIFYVHGISGRPNAGMLILRGRPQGTALAFLKECVVRKHEPVPPEDFVTAKGENGHVIWLLKKEPYRSASKEIERVWNWSIPEHAEKAFVRHYTNYLRDSFLASRANVET